MRISKIICLLQIGIQFSYSSLCVYAFSFNAAAETQVSAASEKMPSKNLPIDTVKGTSSGSGTDTDTDTDNNTSLAGLAAQSGALLSGESSGDALKGMVASGATGKAAQSVESWLNQFGTARVKLSVDNDFSIEDADLDVLLSIYDDKTNLLFTQLGARRADDRNIMNTGIGYRHFSNQWMWGANTFYDRQLSQNHHQRLGVGGELGWDYLKISANGYMRLTEWMASERYQDYDERAANGFDIRTEGYLPSWPQLGASVVFEQYYGDNVDLFNDEDNRQKDPYAVTVGMNYTPFTLMTAGVSQKMGKGDTQDTQFNLSFSYAPGVSLDKQLDASQVAVKRSLLGSRMDLVNRNNTIVLDYRKQDMISLGLPAKIEGAENVSFPISAVINSKYGLDRIDWQADELLQHGGKITDDKHTGQYKITLPNYQYGGVHNHYIVRGKAFDTKGNGSNTSEMDVFVTGYDAATWQSSTTVDPDTLLADGISTSTVTVRVTGADQLPVTAIAPQLAATLKLTPSGKSDATSVTPLKNATITAFNESAPGVYTATFTSGNVAGTADITPVANGKTALQTARIVLQNAVILPTLSSLSASKALAMANGTDIVTLTATVLTSEGLPGQGITVSWKADNAAIGLSAPQSVTDENGVATATVSSLSVVNTVITATLEGGSSLQSESLNFSADATTAQVMTLSADKLQAAANNTDQVTLVANVLNDQNQPLKGAAVDWKVEQGIATLSAPQGSTDELGNAQITLASSVAGDVKVSARAGTTDAKMTDVISFSADTASMTITTLTQDKTQALANGTDTVIYTVIVADANGNKVQNTPISWSSDPSTARLSDSTVNTDDQGQAQVRVSTIEAGDVVISAQLPAGTASIAPATSFIADVSTAKFGVISTDKTQALANGADVITLSTTLTDAQGNPLADADVSWVANPATGVLSASSTKTDAQGVSTIRLTSSEVADYTVNASFNAASMTSPTLSFTADLASAKIDSLVADKTASVVAGKDTVNLTATVLDADSHPVQGTTVNWSSDNASGIFTPVSGVTNAEGVATATFTETHAQVTVVTASIAGSSKTQSLDVIPDVSTAQLSSVTTDKTQLLANGSEIATLTTTLTDANGNLLSDADISWSVEPLTGTLSAVTTKTSAQGIATVTLSSLTVGDSTVTASANNKTASSPVIAFIADVATATITTLTGDKTAAVIAGIDTVTLQATVVDVSNHPVPGITVSWSSDNAAGILTPVSGVTDASGMMTATLTSTLAQNTLVTASTGSNQKTLPVDIIADANTAQVTLVSDKTQALANGTEAITWTATINDANNNPVNTASIDWSGNNADVILSGTNTQTTAAGTTTITGTSVKTGTEIVTATLTQQQRAASATEVSFIADLSTAEVATLTRDRPLISDNGVDVTTFAATVKDATGNALPGVTVNWATTLNTLAGSTSVTDTSGVAIMSISGTQDGDATVTATYGQSSKSAITTFIGSFSADWVINGTSSKFMSTVFNAYDALGFIALAPTTGPTSLIWSGSENTNSPMTASMTDEHGDEVVVNFGGMRQTGCTVRTFNSAVSCQAGPMSQAILNYSSSENPSLPAGVYRGVIRFAGVTWASGVPSFTYEVSVLLTVD